MFTARPSFSQSGSGRCERQGGTEQESTGNRVGQGGDGGGPRTEEQSKEITILYTNAQSLQNKINKLTVTAEDLKPDLILIVETWCNDTVLSAALKIPGYHFEEDLRRDRTDTGRGVGGGLAVYSKEGLKVWATDKFKDNAFNQFI